MVDNLIVHEQFSNSDHNFITFDLFCDVSMSYWNELYHDLRQGNCKVIKNEPGLIDFLEMFLGKNADNMWLVFENKFNDVVEKKKPIRRRRRSNKPLWWSKDIDKVWKRKKRCRYNYELS